MVEKKKVEEQVRSPSGGDQQQQDEERQPGWIQKYLDLADLLIRRRRPKSEDKDKAA
jgi:hypothetical protein